MGSSEVVHHYELTWPQGASQEVFHIKVFHISFEDLLVEDLLGGRSF